MTADLQSYIETEILPTAGIVEENSDPITTLKAMQEWINTNLHVIMPITVKSLTDYIFLDNEGIISKRRTLYVNWVDFCCLDLPLLGEENVNQHKEILNVLIIPVPDMEKDTFYYCTDDEWNILNAK